MVPLFGCRMCKSCITSKNSSLPLGRSVASSLIRSLMLKRRRLSTARKIKHFLLLTDNNRIQHHNFHLFRQQNTHTASYDNLIYKLFTLFFIVLSANIGKNLVTISFCHTCDTFFKCRSTNI